MPRVGAGRERAERGGDRARRQLTELVAADAADVLHRADPPLLRHVVRELRSVAHLRGRRDVQHRVPVDRGVALRVLRCRARGRRRDVHELPRLAGRLRAVDEPVSARPHRVARTRQIRNHVAALIVGDNNLDVANWKIVRLGDDPDAGFRSARPGDDAADVVCFDRDRRALWLKEEREKGCDGDRESHDRPPVGSTILRAMRATAGLIARLRACATGVALITVVALQAQRPPLPNVEWRHYGGMNLGHQHYSPLAQIDASNFNHLEVAWRFKTDSLGPRPEFKLEGTALEINGVIYTTAGTRRAAIALDAATGELRWTHAEYEGARAAA